MTTHSETPGSGFITLEGGDAVGKSTNIALVAELIRATGRQVVVTREPGGTRLGERIRTLVLHDLETALEPDAETLLIFAARAQHIAEVIRPALAAGKWVICDRFTDATYAYQGGGAGVAARRIAVIEQWVQQGLEPDLTLLLDAPAEAVASRRPGRCADRDRFEVRESDYKQRVRQSYLDRARLEPDRYCIVDATASLDVVQACITRAVNSLVDRIGP